MFILNSCNKIIDNPIKENLKRPVNNKGGKSASITFQYNPANPYNLYDSTGIYHNLGLAAIICEPDTLDCESNLFINQAKWTIAYWKMSWGDNGNYVAGDYYEYLVDIEEEFIGLTPLELINTYIPVGDARDYALSLHSLITNYADTNDIKPLNDSIVVWEGEVMNSQLSPSSKKMLLEMGSIARWSAAYWFEQYKLKELSDWWDFPCASNFKNKNNSITAFSMFIPPFIMYDIVTYVAAKVFLEDLGVPSFIAEPLAIGAAAVASAAALLSQ